MTVRPFLKWAGGKQWLTRVFDFEVPHGWRYVEPFLGGGALFFHVRPQLALLTDFNPELINLYQVIRDYPENFQFRMEKHQAHHSEIFYYEMRDCEYENPIDKAARFLYLNRTCWNGLYRVNKFGKFNVPKGTKTSVVFSGESFREYSDALRGAKIHRSDFEATFENCGTHDFVFADPPYTVKHNMNGFVRYNERIFSWSDQERLLESIRGAVDRGSVVIVANADHPSIHEIYGGECRIVRVGRHSVLSGKNEHRRKITECLYVFGEHNCPDVASIVQSVGDENSNAASHSVGLDSSV